MRILLFFIIVFLSLEASGQEEYLEYSDVECPVKSVGSIEIKDVNYPPRPDTSAVRLFVFYSLDDTANYNISQQDYIYAIQDMIKYRGNEICHKSGIVDTNYADAFTIVAFKGIPEESFGDLDYGCRILTKFHSPNDGILDPELQEFRCSNAHTAVFITPEFVKRPDGCASSAGYIQVRSFWINIYKKFGIDALEKATTKQDSISAVKELYRASNTMFHELGHNMGGKHFAGEGDDETVGVYYGTSQYGTLPSIMHGAYGNSSFHFSNIHGPEPLTDGIVDHGSAMIENRVNKHIQKPKFEINVKQNYDTLYVNDSTTLHLQITSNYASWESNNELNYKILLPDGSYVNNSEININSSAPYLRFGSNEIKFVVQRECDFGPADSVLIRVWLSDINSNVPNHINQENIEIFPNPADEELCVTSKIILESFEILSLSGEKVLTGDFENGYCISTGHLPSGTYILKMHLEHGFLVEKVLII